MDVDLADPGWSDDQVLSPEEAGAYMRAVFRQRRRADLGKSSDSLAIRISCGACGRNIGRLVGSTEGGFARLEGIAKITGIMQKPVSSPNTVSRAGPAIRGRLLDRVRASVERYRVTCTKCSKPGRPWVRTYRRDTLERVFAKAVKNGRRTLTVDVDL